VKRLDNDSSDRFKELCDELLKSPTIKLKLPSTLLSRSGKSTHVLKRGYPGGMTDAGSFVGHLPQKMLWK